MGKFTKVLNRLNPRTGRIITESGEYVNSADLAKKMSEAMDPFGPMRITEYQPVFSSLPLPINLINDRTFTSGGATVEYVDGELKLDRAAGETCALLTAQRGRYQSGLVGVPGIGIRRGTNPTGTTTYYWGYFDQDSGSPYNGFGFREDSTGVETTVFRNGTEVYHKPRSQWLDRLDGTGPSGLSIETTDGLVARYPFGYYGYMTIEFGIVVPNAPDKKDEFIVVDRVNFRGQISLPYANLAIAAFIVGDGPGTLYVGGRQYGVYGQLNLRRKITGEYRTGQTISAANGFVPTISVRVRPEQPYVNVPLQVAGFSIKTDGALDWVIVIGDVINNDGEANWNISSLSVGDTSAEFNLAATSATGGEIVGGPGIISGSGGANVTSESFDIPDQDIPVGEPATLLIQSHSGSINVRTAMRVAELR